MNLFTIDFQSASLHKQTTVNVLCPQEAIRTSEIPSLTLLHGMTDDQTGWLRRSLAENYAEKLGVCLIIPNADLSFYTDMAYGGDYLTFLAVELPDFLKNYFPLTKARERNFVAGNSMGGYGAFLLAMRYPGQFAAAFSLSGPMKIGWIYRILSDTNLVQIGSRGDGKNLREAVTQLSEKENIPELLINSLLESGDMTRIFRGMFGNGETPLEGSGIDLIELMQRETFGADPVDLYAYCGEQDYHYESNLLFRRTAERSGIPYCLKTGSGSHDWDYWNRQIPDIFGTIEEYLKQGIFAEGI